MGFSGVFGSRPVVSGGGGAGALTILAANSTATLTSTNMNRRHHSVVSSDITLTLPTVTGLSNWAGQVMEFNNDLSSTANVILDPNGSEPILIGKWSNLTLTLAPGDSIALRLDYTNGEWHCIHDGIAGPWARVDHDGADQGFTTLSYVLMPFNTVAAGNDPYGIVDTSASNYDVTPGQLGDYIMYVRNTVNAAAYVANVGAAIFKNGSFYKSLMWAEQIGDMAIPAMTPVVVDAVTDYFDVRINGLTGDEFTDAVHEPELYIRRVK